MAGARRPQAVPIMRPFVGRSLPPVRRLTRSLCAVPWSHLCLVLLLFNLAGMQPASSQGQPRPHGSRPQPLWRTPLITLSWAPSSLPSDLAPETVRVALSTAASAWSRETVRCTGVSIAVEERSRTIYGGTRDGINSVVFHSRRFCRRGIDRPGHCYDPRMAAITSLHVDDDRHVVEADVELNAVAFDFRPSLEKQSETRIPMDLTSTLVHELGHVLGFTHTCTIRGNAIENDIHGQPLPTCDAAPRRVLRSVMVPAVDIPGGPISASRAVSSLSRVDRRTLCRTYPRSRRFLDGP